MSNKIPFLFCRYSAHIDEEYLDADGLLAALTEVQGKYLPQGPTDEKNNVHTVVVMKPRKLDVEIGGAVETIVTWAIGNRPGHRTVTSYNSNSQEITYTVEGDAHIFHSSIIAVPRLGAMAVNDRTNALNMGGRPALRRCRAAFRQIEDGAFSYWFLAPSDVKSIVGELDLKEYSYTARRINPTSPSALAKAFDATMEQEDIEKLSGIAKPKPGGSMHAKGGVIEATTDLVTVGYAVAGFKGHTKGGHLAQIRKPPFSMDKQDNLKQMEKEQPLRVFIEADKEDDALIPSIVAELVRFYDRDESGETDVPEGAD